MAKIIHERRFLCPPPISGHQFRRREIDDGERRPAIRNTGTGIFGEHFAENGSVWCRDGQICARHA